MPQTGTGWYACRNRPMIRLPSPCWLSLTALLAVAPLAMAQPITGAGLSHRSSGSGVADWTLNENGYVGTYFTLAAPGSVTLTVEASGSTTDAVNPLHEHRRGRHQGWFQRWQRIHQL